MWSADSAIVNYLVGPLPIKVVRDAVLAGDEEKAMAVFIADMVPDKTVGANAPISTTKGTGVTLLHLGSQQGLYQFIKMLLDYKGNPNITTARSETALHFLCSQADAAEQRKRILDMFLTWRGDSSDSNGDSISVNRIDADGNSALQKASSNGLLDCVLGLIDNGAIISIVNKSQLTCCELADENGHRELAAILELALMFQPEDEETASFIAGQHFQYENQQSRLIPDCKSLKIENVSDYAKDVITSLHDSFRSDSKALSKSITRSRVVVFLEKYSWDISRLRRDFKSNAAAVFANCAIPEECIPYPPWDMGPWPSDESKQAVTIDNSQANASSESTQDKREAGDEAADNEAAGTPAIDSTEQTLKPAEAAVDNEDLPTPAPVQSEEGGVVCINDISFDDDLLVSDEPSNVHAPEEIQSVHTEVGTAGASVSAETPNATTVSSSTNNPQDAAASVPAAAPIEQMADRASATPALTNDSEVAAVPNTEEIPKEQEPTMRVRLVCPGIRLRIRPEPSTSVSEIGYALSGNELEVVKEPKNGFYKLAGDQQGYIQKQVSGVYWEQLDSGCREFVTENCIICGEELLPPVPPALLLTTAAADGVPNDSSNGDGLALNAAVPNVEQRAIYCSSGHGFCLNCWRMNSTTQVRENGAFSIKCPAYKCNEILGDEWLPIVLDGPTGPVTNRYQNQFTHHVVDCCKGLQRCPRNGCEHIVVAPDASQFPSSFNSLPSEITQQLAGIFVQCGICMDGHSFCFQCNKEAHAPCSCSDWVVWQRKVGDEMKALGMALPSDDANPSTSEEMANALWVAANTKQCPRCNSHIEKDEGCNHMR
jgi:hypothetical protein